MFRLLPLLICFVLAGACGGDECAELASRLAGASAGERIELGACRADGVFSVPPGVIVAGAGPATVLAASEGAAAVTLAPGARLESLTIESDADVGLSASGTGEAIAITDVTVRASRGIAARFDEAAIELARVSFVGPVTEDNADSVPSPASSAEWATHGLVITSSGSSASPVVLEDVTTSGFARFGALFVDSHVAWRGGGATANLPVGLMAQGGSVVLDGVELGDTLAGVQAFAPAGAIFRDGVDVTTTDVLASQNHGYGIIQDGSTVSHANLVASDNTEPAVWLQSAAMFELAGDASELSGNMLAGIVVGGGSSASIRDALVSDTETAMRIGSGGPVSVGDGIHVVLESAAGLSIESVTLTNNERAGVLLALADGAPEAATLTGITVDATGTSFGAVAQRGTSLIASGGWDDGITRLGATMTNDASLTTALETVGIIGPMFLPAF
jgi:hypothetical protein